MVEPYLKVHVLAPGLNYGQHAFEGIKAYRTADGQISVFRPDVNAARLQRSNAMLSIPPIPADHFQRCVDLAVGLNSAYVPPHVGGGALYIRPVAFGSAAQLGLVPGDAYTFYVTVVPTGVYHGADPIDGLVLEDFDRTAPRGTGAIKCGGNYAPVLRHARTAHAAGFGITLHLDAQTRSEIDEFSTAGFVGIKTAGTTVTLVIPDSPTILVSSTSVSVCEIARSLGYAVEKRRVPVEELADFDEVCAAGTAAALVPVKSITLPSRDKKWTFKGQDGVPGPIVTKLLGQLRGIQTGELDDTFGWRHYVADPNPWVREQEVRAMKNGAKNGTHWNGENPAVDVLP